MLHSVPPPPQRSKNLKCHREARISPQIRLKSDTHTRRASSKLAFISLIIHRATLCFLLQSQCSSRHITISLTIKSLRDYIQYNTTLWLSTGKIFFYAPQHCTGRLPTRWGNSYFAVEGHLDWHERFSVRGVHCLNGLYIVTTFRGIRFM